MSWGFGLSDWASQEGFFYELEIRSGQLIVREGDRTFFDSKQAVPREASIVLELRWSRTNFVPTIEMVGMCPPIRLPSRALPETTHLCATVDLPIDGPVDGPVDGPAIRLNRWRLDVA
ncbi:MAG: hypothetical protein ACI957_001095 [Verrucomicrobiales bacterium]|jgi:hypothetical protein